MYRYEMIAKSDENPTERRLFDLAAETGAIRLQIDDLPERHFIEESSTGYIKYPSRICGYCSHDGKYICVRRGLAPKEIVATTIHEMRHAYQCQDAKLRMCDGKMRETDAELFVREFFGNHSDSGDAATLERTLNEILKEDLNRIWKRACASARAKLSKPTNTESDQLRRQFEPILRARSLRVQQLIDPSGRGLFPPGVEFSAPCSGLKVSY